jgi:ABC-type multidrug transport system fused ATPase/permease subunit
MLDGVDTAKIPLGDLRSKSVTTILQDAVLFSGTVRSNLQTVFPVDVEESDVQSSNPTRSRCCGCIPLLSLHQRDISGGQYEMVETTTKPVAKSDKCDARCYSDERMWEVLRRVRLEDTVRAHPMGLDMAVREGSGGGSLSAGEVQLLCLARSLLRCPSRGGVVLCDEPASCVDAVTRDTVLSTVLSLPATLILVCHRLEGLERFDGVAVMDSGSLLEYGPPSVLLANPASSLSGLMRENGHMHPL